MNVGNWTCMLSFISNVCLKYATKWMVSSLIFQKFSGEGLTELPPQTPPPIFLGLRPRFGLRPQFSGASRLRLGLRPRFSGASRPRFGLRPQLSIGELGLAPPKINSWIRHWLTTLQSFWNVNYYMAYNYTISCQHITYNYMQHIVLWVLSVSSEPPGPHTFFTETRRGFHKNQRVFSPPPPPRQIEPWS